MADGDFTVEVLRYPDDEVLPGGPPESVEFPARGEYSLNYLARGEKDLVVRLVTGSQIGLHLVGPEGLISASGFKPPSHNVHAARAIKGGETEAPDGAPHSMAAKVSPPANAQAAAKTPRIGATRLLVTVFAHLYPAPQRVVTRATLRGAVNGFRPPLGSNYSGSCGLRRTPCARSSAPGLLVSGQGLLRG